MEFLNPFPTQQQVCYLTPEQADFESCYLQIRHLEGRVYSDDLVHQLPYVPANHPQAKEWGLRHEATEKIIEYIQQKKATKVLDLGCGNGWFTHRLAEQTEATVLGVDVNKTELEQAARLFTTERCRFVYGDIFAGDWPETYFDIIILNSCVQYFGNLDRLLRTLLRMIQPSGEIHIIDSPFYAQSELPQAQKRSRQYYLKQGVEGMIDHYHHHSWESLSPYCHRILYHPRLWRNRLRRKLSGRASPFPWIAIQHPAL
ncbi:MAG: class I SAM-dependent methyltransferase [Bacteroidota bacterium]